MTPILVLVTLLGVELLLVGAHISVFIFPTVESQSLRELVDLGYDLSIPNWFSSMQLLAVSAVMFATASHTRGPRRLLIAGGFVFLFLSVDEGVAVHEKITDVVRTRELPVPMFPGDHGAWITVYAILGLIGLILLARPLKEMWQRHRRQALIAIAGVATYVAGAVMVEIVGYFLGERHLSSRVEQAQVVVEELFEMAGVSIILFAVLELFTSSRPPAVTDQAG